MKLISFFSITLLLILMTNNDCLANDTINVSTPNILGHNLPDFKEATNKTVKGLMYIIALSITGLVLYKKFSPKASNKNNQITISSRYNLGPKSALLVVCVEGQRFLVGQTSESFNLITPLETEFQNTLLKYSDTEITQNNNLSVNG